MCYELIIISCFIFKWEPLLSVCGRECKFIFSGLPRFTDRLIGVFPFVNKLQKHGEHKPRHYGGLQLSHQIQITHIKYKLLTSNTNYSHQIQITHIKYKLLTSNYKLLTSNTNYSHQIQITHIKYKLLTSNTNYSHQIQIVTSIGQRLSQ